MRCACISLLRFLIILVCLFAQIVQIAARVNAVASRVLPGIATEVTGSFRRGLPTCGDCDLIFTHPLWVCILFSSLFSPFVLFVCFCSICTFAEAKGLCGEKNQGVHDSSHSSPSSRSAFCFLFLCSFDNMTRLSLLCTVCVCPQREL